MEPLDTVIAAELDKLYRFAYRKTGDAYRAEDLTQDIVLKAYTVWPSLRDPDRIVPWLWGIAHNLAKQKWREDREVPAEDTELIRICDGSGVSWETPETMCLQKWEISRVRQAVAYLAKSYRDVCVLYYLEEKDYSTIARELDIPISSVKWRLNQSKVRLREELESMEFMEKNYHKAVPLQLNMGGWVNHWDREKGCYDNADKALEGLLAQNICQVAYEKPATVTEISSALGVAAEYVEEALEKLTAAQCMIHKSNTWQTALPIWTKEMNTLVFDGNYAIAEENAGGIIDTLYALESRIWSVGFWGCDKPMDKLMLMLCSFLTYNTAGNQFDTDRLPFRGEEKAWYILATTAPAFRRENVYDCVGLNTNGSMFGFMEFFLAQNQWSDNRSDRTAEQHAMEDLYHGKPVQDEYLLSHLVELGKAEQKEGTYRLTVPVLSRSKGEWAGLLKALEPVLELTGKIQQQMNARSLSIMQKVIPPHLKEQRVFFSTYCTHGSMIIALYEELMRRGLSVTREMPTWLVVE